MKKPISHPLVRGSIDLVRGNLVHGWFYGYGCEMRPLVMVNGRSATLIQDQVPRPDVCSALGIAEDEQPGFIFELPGASSGELVELYAAGSSSCTIVAEKELACAVIEQNLLAQAARAARIARQPGAVGIVCWDGAHNPVGRAYELYQISAKIFPTVLICYLNAEFGSKLWHPLQNEDMNIITIPWRKRFSGEKMLHDLGINFQTIWICKPRLPEYKNLSSQN